MQLKMSKTFNAKLAQRILEVENKYISNLFSKMALPMSEIVQLEEESEPEEQPTKKRKTIPGHGDGVKRAQTFEELHGRLEALKGKKLDYKQKLIKKGLKNRIKKKTKQGERALQKKLARIEHHASGGAKIKVEENGSVKPVPKPKPVFNSEGKMVFSKFDFSEIGTKKKPPKTEKDPKKVLQQIKQRNEKLRQLEQTGEKDKAVEIKEKEAWKTVLAKASGQKVKDDPELLKKTMRREEQKKKHSAKKWDSRLQAVDKAKQERQQKRQENIMKRKKEKKVNKLKKASKKGRVIPGF
ncbi:surfeit locus protein 6 homolog [Orussus abietinus]|uniref:surfeit locus protein 6 homolog n=1 Tax=Orussus abietinus TaxID=222816 RepID=UPI000625AF3D|nr:surfeit locus protein 6 homolog [Orussus abietinus]